MKFITILIVEDHKLVREAWKIVLNDFLSFNVVDTCGTAELAIESVKHYAPEIVLLDINLPGMNGIEAIPLMLQAAPATKIISISMHSTPNYACKMLQLGASGYLTKSSSQAEMIEAITAVHGGEKYICSEIKAKIAEQFIEKDSDRNKLNTLSRRELEIIELIKKGLSSKEIAKTLAISFKTTEVHRYNILKKLGLKKTASLINYINQN